MQPAIRVKNLGKRYKIGLREQANQNFREALVGLATAPIRRLRRLREQAGEDETIWALKDVSFEVQPGEVVGIIGRNGAGKTTLLKILSRITEPTEGRVELAGRVASLLEVGTGFHPELTGRENIYLNGAILGMKKAEIDRKFDEIVAFAETEKFLDTPVKRYSSGMYIRLAFAVAAHLEPEILMVDEVLAVGDAGFQKKCLGKMQEISRQEGKTVLFVSHNLYAVQTLCSRALWLSDGQLAFDGKTAHGTAQYKKSFMMRASSLREPDDRDSKDVQILLLEVNGMTGGCVALGVPSELHVVFEFRVCQALELAFGVSLSTTDGIYLCGLGTHLEGRTYRLSPGSYRFGAKFNDLSLATGIYMLKVSVMDGLGNHAYCLRSPAATIDVNGDFAFDGLVGLRHEWIPPQRIEESRGSRAVTTGEDQGGNI